MNVTLGNGKYEFKMNADGWSVDCLRHGEPWMTFEKGHNALISLMTANADLRRRVQELESHNNGKVFRELPKMYEWRELDGFDAKICVGVDEGKEGDCSVETLGAYIKGKLHILAVKRI